MEDKRYLFRGFHRGNGNTVITLNGEKICGEWVFGCYVYDKQSCCIRDFGYEYKSVLPETVGQWITTDKNGKDVFEGDIVRFTDKYGSRSSGIAKIERGEYGFRLNGMYDKGAIRGTYVWVSMSAEMLYEIRGNKWEVQE